MSIIENIRLIVVKLYVYSIKLLQLITCHDTTCSSYHLITDDYTLASSSVSLPSEIVHSRILAQNHNSHNISLYIIKLYCYIYFIQSQD